MEHKKVSEKIVFKVQSSAKTVNHLRLPQDIIKQPTLGNSQ